MYQLNRLQYYIGLFPTMTFINKKLILLICRICITKLNENK